MTLVTNFSFNAAGPVMVDNIFSSLYRNYLVIVNIFGTQGANHVLNMRRNGITDTASNYSYGAQVVIYGQTTVGGSSNLNTTSWPEGSRATANDRGSSHIMFYSPQLAEKTFYQASTTDAQITRTVGGVFNANTQFDGFVFTPQAGTLSGNIRVYGLRD
jgi:hypothetical protein